MQEKLKKRNVSKDMVTVSSGCYVKAVKNKNKAIVRVKLFMYKTVCHFTNREPYILHILDILNKNKRKRNYFLTLLI